MRKISALALVLIITGIFATSGFAQSPEESLSKDFPQIKFDSMRLSNIKGLYEVTAGNEILYYSPEARSIIVGEVYTKDGRNLTREKQQENITKKIGEKMKDISLQKAVIIGKGKHIIVEITDPDCPYCRRASDFFSKRTDVTRYVFFYPLPSHPKAKDKALYVLCSKDKAKAYEDAMTGKLDNIEFKICEEAQPLELLKAHKDVADLLEIRGTPFFFIDGKTAVFGADIPQLEKLLQTGTTK
jgi:thiol:disulfide interchange protein DsbC